MEASTIPKATIFTLMVMINREDTTINLMNMFLPRVKRTMINRSSPKEKDICLFTNNNLTLSLQIREAATETLLILLEITMKAATTATKTTINNIVTMISTIGMKLQ